MNRRLGILAAVLAVGAAGAAGWLVRSRAEDKPAAPPDKPGAADADKPDSPALAAVKKTAEAFAKAFNAGDAKAVAAFCTKEVEYVGPEGEAINGRDALEKAYGEFFKNNPKAKIDVKVESVKLLGGVAAVEEGALVLHMANQREPNETRYTVLHVKEDDGWKMAAIREWTPDPNDASVKDLEWMLGDWVGKGDGVEVRVHCAWDEDKTFLRSRYTLKKGEKVVSSGTQVMGVDPAGGLRSWAFDSSGAFGESVWTRDGDRWVSESSGTLPDGSEITSQNVMIPLTKDAFTFQSLERTAAGTALPSGPPLKVTRVKADE
jgi:uncharacterized protein (TIGR02246 family)